MDDLRTVSVDRRVSWSEPAFKIAAAVNSETSNSEDDEKLLSQESSHSQEDNTEKIDNIVGWKDFKKVDNTTSGGTCNVEAKKSLTKKISPIQQRKSSILNRVIEMEKRKSEYCIDDKRKEDNNSVSQDSFQTINVEEKTKCCGLIKYKKKNPNIGTTQSITVRTSQFSNKKNEESAR